MPPRTRHRLIQIVDEPAAILVVIADVLAHVAARHHAVDRALEINAKSSWHPLTVCGKEWTDTK